jgi:Holliday junction resolvasome RuvABC endonuclease subunit
MFIGIDYSMSSPAMCLLSSDGSFKNSQHYFLSSKKKDLTVPSQNIHCGMHKPYQTEIERYTNIADFFLQVLVAIKEPLQIFIEDYSMGSKGRIFAIAENTAILKYKIVQAGFSFSTFPPTVIKKYASGKGNADKDMMYKAFLDKGHSDIKRFYHEKPNAKVASPVSDIVDAFFIAELGSQKYQTH